MASDTDCMEDVGTHVHSDGDVSSSQQARDDLLQNVDDRLVTLCEKLDACHNVLNDLKDLSDVLVRKSLQDVSLPPKD